MSVGYFLLGGAIGVGVFTRDNLTLNEKIVGSVGGCLLASSILIYGSLCVVKRRHVGWSSKINRGKFSPGFYLHNPFKEHLYMAPKVDSVANFTVQTHGTAYEIFPFSVEMTDEDKAIFTFYRCSPSGKDAGDPLSLASWKPVQQALALDVQKEVSSLDTPVSSEDVASELTKALSRRGYRLRSMGIPIAAYPLN